MSHSDSINLDKSSIEDDDKETDDIVEEEGTGHSTSSNAVKDDKSNLDTPDTENDVMNNEIQSIGPSGPVEPDLPVHALTVSSVSNPDIITNNENISVEKEESLLGVRKMPSKISQKRRKIGRFSGQSFVLSHLNEDEEAEN